MLANPTEMIRAGAPRLIHTDEELAEYTEALFELTSREERSKEDEEAIKLLAVLINRYESEKYPVPEAKPAGVLRFLLDQNGLAQRDIAGDVGGESIVSLVLAGKRQMDSGVHCSVESTVWSFAGGFLRLILPVKLKDRS